MTGDKVIIKVDYFNHKTCERITDLVVGLTRDERR